MSDHIKELKLIPFLSLESSTVLVNLAKAYGFNLSDFDSDICLKLKRKFYDDLILERKKGSIITLTQSFKKDGDILYNPRITFLANRVRGSKGLLIYPLTFTSSVEDIQEQCASLAPDSSSLESIDTKLMQRIANRSNTQLSIIKDQNWFLPASKPNPDIKVTKA